VEPVTHWNEVYRRRASTEVSWYAPELSCSLGAITKLTGPAARVIDVGGGASTLVDDLLRLGYRQLSVLDVSEAALEVAQTRLGLAARDVRWIAADVTTVDLPDAAFDLWHDRAVFHFLTEPAARRAYVERAWRSIVAGGHLVMTVFALHGPERCSGLPVVRYDAPSLAHQLGAGFRLGSSSTHEHTTPDGKTQHMLFCTFVRC
jgi:SAM-dependent methyltransferase